MSYEITEITEGAKDGPYQVSIDGKNFRIDKEVFQLLLMISKERDRYKRTLIAWQIIDE